MTTVAQAPEVAQDLLESVEDNEIVIRDGHFAHFGVKGWFQAFLKSDDFANMSREEKDSAVSLYFDLHEFLAVIDCICDKFDRPSEENVL